MTSSRQLTLDLIRPPRPALDNFVVGRNAEALAALAAIAGGGGESFVYLWGETGAGRSHLLAALSDQPRARAAPAGQTVPPHCDERALYLVDDVQTLDADGQQRLFVLMNEIRARADARLVAAGDAPPAQLALRDDVRTRLAWGLVYQVHALTDEEKAGTLQARAHARGLTLSVEVISYLLTHMPRDMRTLVAVLDAVDSYALATKRAVTVPLVREWVQQAA